MNVEHGPFFTRRPHPAPVADAARATLMEDPGFGRVFTDHMATIRWTEARGWCDAEIQGAGALRSRSRRRGAALRPGDFRGPQGLPAERRGRRPVPTPNRTRAASRPRPNGWRCRFFRRLRSCGRSRS